jgi:hypothetical protein
LRFGPEEVRLWGGGGCERSARVSFREGLVLDEGADGAAGKRDVSKTGEKCYVPAPSLGDGLEFVDVNSEITFDGNEMNA